MSRTVEDKPGLEPEWRPKVEGDPLEFGRPLAVFLVGGADNLGPHSLRVFRDNYKDKFSQVLFVSVGVLDHDIIDSGVDKSLGFKGTEEARRLRGKTRLDLDPYLEAAHDLGLKADCRVSIATDPVDEIDAVAAGIVREFPQSVFFVSKLVLPKAPWVSRLLFGTTADQIRKRLEEKGILVTVIPVVVKK